MSAGEPPMVYIFKDGEDRKNNHVISQDNSNLLLAVLYKREKENYELNLRKLKSWNAKFIHEPGNFLEEEGNKDEITVFYKKIFPDVTSIDKEYGEIKPGDGYTLVSSYEVPSLRNACDEGFIYTEAKSYNPEELIYTLVAMWILGIRDDMMDSIFFDTKTGVPIIVDLSVVDKHSEKNNVFYLSDSSETVCGKWFENMGRYYANVADRIKNLNDASYQDKINEAVKLLDRYYEEWRMRYGKSPVKQPEKKVVGNQKFFDTLLAKSRGSLIEPVDANNNRHFFVAKAKGKGLKIFVGPLSEEEIKVSFDKYKLLDEWGAKYIRRPGRKPEKGFLVYDGEFLSHRKEEKSDIVVSYEGIVKLAKVCDSEWTGKKDGDYDPVELLFTLVAMWILDIDSYDSFVDPKTKEFYFFDYSIKGYDGQHRVFYLTIEEKDCESWFKNMGRYYNDVDKKLEELPPNEKYNNRIDKARDLLAKYSEEWKSKYGISRAPKSPGRGGPGPSYSSSRSSSSSSSGPSSGISSGISRSKTPRRPAYSRRSTSGGSPSSRREEDRGGMITDMQLSDDLGKMVSKRGAAQSLTFSGLELSSVMKNLRLYILQGNCEKSRIMAIEIYRMRRNMSDNTASEKFTKLVNELKSIAVRDIGIGNFDVTISILDYFNHHENKDIDFDAIDQIVTLMCKSPKSKIIEAMYHINSTGTCIGLIGTRKYRDVEDIENKITDRDYEIIDEYFDNRMFKAGDTEKLKDFALTMYSRLLDYRSDAIHWVHKFLEEAEKIKSTAKRPYYLDRKGRLHESTKAVTILWNVIDKLFKEYPDDHISKVVDIIKEASFNDDRKLESGYYLTLAIMTIILSKDLDYEISPIGKTKLEDLQWLFSGNYKVPLLQAQPKDKSRALINPVSDMDEEYRAEIDLSQNC